MKTVCVPLNKAMHVCHGHRRAHDVSDPLKSKVGLHAGWEGVGVNKN